MTSFVKTKKGTGGIILILAILAIVAYLVITGNTFGNKFAIAGANAEPQITGGTITSFANVTLLSNYGPLNGPAFLSTFVINGNGQFLSGTQSSIVKGINSSYSSTSSNPVSINYNLNSEKLLVPYTFSGADLYKWGYTVVNTGYAPPGCPFGLVCSSSYTNGLFSYAQGTYLGGAPYPTLIPVANGFIASCTATNKPGATVIYNGQAQIPVLAGTVAGFNLECIVPTQTSIAQVYSPGAANLGVNVSIIFTNGTITKTLYMTDSVPSASYSNILYAQIYGYLSSGKNIVTSYPTLISFSNATSKFVNQVSLSTALQASSYTYSTGFPSTWLVPSFSLGGNSYSNVYAFSSFSSSLNQTNAQLNNYLYAQQSTNPAAGMTINLNSGNATASLNITSNPEYYPEVQLAAKLATLNPTIPVSEPVITSVTPSTVNFQSGSSQPVIFTVTNNATVTGSAYISGACGNSTFATQSFSVPSKGQGSVSEGVVITSPYNPNLAKASVSCSATAYSTTGALYKSSIIFSGTVSPNCPAGYIYVNNTDCKPINPTLNNSNGTKGTICVGGYQLINGICTEVNRCPVNYYLNTTVTPAVCDPNVVPSSKGGIGIGWYILGIFVVLVLILFGLRKRATKYGKAKGKKFVKN